MTPRGLVVDFGGVLTSPVTQSFRAFSVEAGLDADLVKRTVIEAYGEPRQAGPVERIERGEISDGEFARALAQLLTDRSGVHIGSEGLVARLFAFVEPDETMLAGVAAIHAAGVTTALLSNSWGHHGQGGVVYPRERFGELFDAVVISGEVGLRKPDQEIFRLAADRLGLAPRDCVFVDDLRDNIEAAEALGMIGVRHREAGLTLARLAELFNLDPDLLPVSS